MKIGILTSSRADFGIYLPLISELKGDPEIELEIIAFGTHLSSMHGRTIDDIKEHGFNKIVEIPSVLASDDEESISTAFGLTSLKFSSLWSNRSYDLVFCIGDRYEMAAAVSAGIPFNITFAHIHGGETTLGAIDNIYRHSISLSSKYHFVTTEPFKKRLTEIVGSDKNIYVTGSLGLVNLKNIKLLSKEDFLKKWNIDLNKKTILVTVHPDTVKVEKNQHYSEQTRKFVEELSKNIQIVITMPNADTLGSIYRDVYKTLNIKNPQNIHLIENFGTQSYFTCMNYCDLIIGNSSSGIIEAASFKKVVLNVGDRQKGRLSNKNVIHVPFDADSILKEFDKWTSKVYSGSNIYEKGETVEIICNEIKNILNE